MYKLQTPSYIVLHYSQDITERSLRKGGQFLGTKFKQGEALGTQSETIRADMVLTFHIFPALMLPRDA